MCKEIIFYVILVIIFILIIAWGYIKLKYHFWSCQPVFHIYDYHYNFYSAGIIKDEVEINRYCNFTNIYNDDYEKISEIRKNSFQHLVYLHFTQSDIISYSPKRENIDPYFSGHNGPCFISLYYKDNVMRDHKSGDLITNDKLVGCMTTRPLIVDINDKTNKGFTCGYVDYLCVNKNNRKQNIAPDLIQTTYYHTRKKDLSTHVYLFKREGDLTYIIPLCIYKCYTFNMQRWLKPLDFTPNEGNILETTSSSIHLVIDFLKDSLTKFKMTITPNIGNLLELMRSKNVYLYYLLIENEIKSLYLFRNTCTTIKNIGVGLDCIGSVNMTSNNLFIHGYKVSLWKILEKNPEFKYNVIENISDNSILINNLLIKNEAMSIYPCAYYYYNYISKTYSGNDLFIIN